MMVRVVPILARVEETDKVRFPWRYLLYVMFKPLVTPIGSMLSSVARLVPLTVTKGQVLSLVLNPDWDSKSRFTRRSWSLMELSLEKLSDSKFGRSSTYTGPLTLSSCAAENEDMRWADRINRPPFSDWRVSSEMVPAADVESSMVPVKVVQGASAVASAVPRIVAVAVEHDCELSCKAAISFRSCFLVSTLWTTHGLQRLRGKEERRRCQMISTISGSWFTKYSMAFALPYPSAPISHEDLGAAKP